MRKRFTRNARFAPRSATRLALYSMLGGCALAWSGLACALGLGDITLHSALNQPLNADITLADSTGLEEGDITVTLGTPEEFARAGVDRSFFLTDLRFTPVFRNGRKVIHVSSSKAVLEPYVSFIVQVTQPSGQLLRTYTLLLDPPGTMALPPPLIATNARPEPVSSVAPMPAQAAPPAPPPAALRKKTNEGEGTSRQTSAGEQLTATAAQNKQLQQSVEDLEARLEGLEEERNSKDQQLAELQSRLAEAQAIAAARAALPAASAAPAATAATSAPDAQAPAQNGAPAATPAPVTSTGSGATASVPAAQPQPASAPAPAPAAPAVMPPAANPAPAAPLVVAPETDDLTWLLQLGALLALLLLIAAWLLQRRRQRGVAPQATVLPATVAASDTDTVEPQNALAGAVPVAARREQAPATDALDAASIYIAYGRFNEALGVLREGLQRQPERRDLRLRILEVLGLQGNAHAYAEEEAALRANGESDAVLDQTRARFPRLASAAVALAAGTAAATQLPPAIPESSRSVSPEDFEAPLESDTVASPESVSDTASEFDIDFDALGDLGEPDSLAPSAARGASTDEFHLNLDDMALDTDWSAMDPFDPPPAPAARPATNAPEVQADSAALDESLFFSNLRELPEVLELPEEEFLSDFADEPLALVPEGVGDGDLDAAFLENFADEPAVLADLGGASPIDDATSFTASDAALELELPGDELPDLDELSIDFDDLESQAQAADRLDQARSLLAQGERQEASWLLHELAQDGDEPTREAARQLLAGL